MQNIFHQVEPNEAAQFFGDDMQGWQEYEQKPYLVLCDICGCEAYSTESSLRIQGWFLMGGMEICPEHD